MRVATAVLTAALLGCGSSAPSSGFAVRDSAGIRIVENDTAAAAGRSFQVAPEPSVAIGSADGAQDQQLYRVRDATRLADGRLVVLNSGASEIRFYSPEGRLARTVGRPGAGPGEFRHPEWVVASGDTLLVFDGLQESGRLTLLDLEGELIRSERLEVPGVPFTSPDFLLPDGSYLDEWSDGSIPPTEEGHVVYARSIVRYSRTPTAVDTLVRGVPGTELYRERFRGGMSQSSVPFGREARTAVGSDRIYLSDGDGMAIEVYGLEGEHVMSIRAATESTPVTDADVDRWIEAMLSNPVYQARPDAAERARSRFRAAPIPDAMPAHGEMLVDGEDRLWVRRYTPPWESTNEWWIFDSDGIWIGAASLPPELEPFEIGPDYVLGLRTDALGVERVELYELVIDASPTSRTSLSALVDVATPSRSW